MLRITVPGGDLWDEKNEEFIPVKTHTLQLEHSLVSLSKWESKWHKPFLNKKDKSVEEIVDYVRCMTLTQNVDPNIYRFLTEENIQEINNYIEDPMSATYIYNEDDKGSKEQITAELIYYWMIALQIPVEFQKWHLNRLITLIRVCNVKNTPPKKRSRGEIMRRNAALNAQRRKQLNTKG